MTIVGIDRGQCPDGRGALVLSPSVGIDDMSRADLLLVPGRPGVDRLLTNSRLRNWIRAIDASTQWTTAVCTGSLLLAAAGLLAGRRATTHWYSLSELAAYGVDVRQKRVVVDGKVVTAAGVSAGIDMALELAAVIAGETIAKEIQLAIEYDPRPPFRGGSVAKAAPEVVEAVRRKYDDLSRSSA